MFLHSRLITASVTHPSGHQEPANSDSLSSKNLTFATKSWKCCDLIIFMMIQPITSLHRIYCILLASIAIALICLKNSSLKLLQMAGPASPAEKQSCHEFCLSAGKKCNRDIVDGFWPPVVLERRCV